MKIKHLLFIPVIAALFSCVKDDMNEGSSDPVPETKIFQVAEEDIIPGLMTIQLKEEAASKVMADTRGGGMITGMPEFDGAVAAIKTYKIERAFKGEPKFEARKRKAGLHLWFDVHFDESISTKDAAKMLSAVGEIEQIVPAFKIKMADYKRVTPTVQANDITPSASGFNDPRLGNQWHYNNTGNRPNFEAGADINLFRAWEVTTGHPSVIVAIMDGGVDYTHEDLSQNMWADENGYHGYNCVDNNQDITPADHGTHVAGTVAAVNNNGKGGGGVAGGDGSPTTGARIMSIQITDRWGNFTTNTRTRDGYIWSADHGAVISQNSWGYPGSSLDPTLKAGIDYFIDNAGTDGGPMQGGIVFVATGNEDTNGPYFWPAAYERVFAVAAYGPNYKRASYSNYGAYVEISAPGGDQSMYGMTAGVYSTIPGNGYDYFQGTSMACPHMSGIAALAISKMGTIQPGFTNEQLWDLLKESTLDVDINDKNDAAYYSLLGVGYADAYKAVSANRPITPPAPATDFWGAWQYDNVDLTWTVKPDGSDNPIPTAKYAVLFSENDLTGADFDNPPADARKFTINTGDNPIGAVLRQKVNELQPGTNYYASIIGIDEYNNASEAVMINGTTATAKSPKAVADLSATWGLDFTEATWSVNGDEDGVAVVSYEILISDKEFTDEAFVTTPEHVTKATIEVGSLAIGDPLSKTFESLKENTSYYIAIAGLNSGGYRSPVAAIRGTTQEDKTPEQTSYPSDTYFPSIGHQISINMGDYFTDDLDEHLNYEITVTPASAITVEKKEGSTYVFTSKEYGNAKVTIKASDRGGKYATDEFMTMCRDDSRPMDLYPNPVKDFMYIRLGNNVRGAADVVMYNSSGIRVLSAMTSITTFEPGKVDVTKLPSGNYTVVVTNNNKETKGSITKL